MMAKTQGLHVAEGLVLPLEVVTQTQVTQISPEAWEAAMVLSEVVAAVMAKAGFKPREGRSESTEAMAQLVQHAINRAVAGLEKAGK